LLILLCEHSVPVADNGLEPVSSTVLAPSGASGLEPGDNGRGAGALTGIANDNPYPFWRRLMWTKPEFTEMRFGFEVTMYIYNR
jgi:coenzyme PQQ precursor peptide PqqA